MSVQKIPVEEIQPSPFNTRGEIHEEGLESLVQSIRETGLVEPLKVRKIPEGSLAAYELVIGERRLRALQILGVEYARCIVCEMGDVEVLLEQWSENEEREDISDYGKAQKLRQMLDSFEVTQRELAAKLGKHETWISNHLSFLKLEKYFSSEKFLYQLSEYQARAILSAPEALLGQVCREVESYQLLNHGDLPSASEITDTIKMIQSGGRDEEEEKTPSDHEHVYEGGSTTCRICGRELTAPESVAAGIGPICASGKPAGTPESEFNMHLGRLGIKPEAPTPEAPRYEPSEEEIFRFLNRFRYHKGADGFLLDSLGDLFGLSASQAHDWLERWRNTLSGSTKPTPEEKTIIEEYERTHPKGDDAFRRLSRYYPFEVMDAILSRVQAESIETLIKYCRGYVERLHTRAPLELRQATLQEALR